MTDHLNGKSQFKIKYICILTREQGGLYRKWFCNNVLLNAVKVLPQRTRSTLHEIFSELQSHEGSRGKITFWLLL